MTGLLRADRPKRPPLADSILSCERGSNDGVLTYLGPSVFRECPLYLEHSNEMLLRLFYFLGQPFVLGGNC